MKQTSLVHDGDGWETISTVAHFANPHLEVVTESVRTPLHSKARTWITARRKTAVVIAPMTRDGQIILVQQERIPIRQAIWEMPSGQIDQATDRIDEVGLRELREEAGYELAPDGQLTSLGYFFSSPGFTDEHCYFFLAHPVEPSPAYEREPTESIAGCRPFTILELRQMIANNEIRDANTLGLCARLAARGLISLEQR